MFVLNILFHNLLGMKRQSLGTNCLGTKDPWVQNDWMPLIQFDHLATVVQRFDSAIQQINPADKSFNSVG